MMLVLGVVGSLYTFFSERLNSNSGLVFSKLS